MKTTIILLAAVLTICSCTVRTEQFCTANANTPTNIVLGFVQAMNAGDSVTIEDELLSTSKELILAKLRSMGGFKMMFVAMKGMHVDVKIIGIDSVSQAYTKVFTNQTIIKDSTINMKLDSLYYSLSKEKNGCWKLMTINARSAP